MKGVKRWKWPVLWSDRLTSWERCLIPRDSTMTETINVRASSMRRSKRVLQQEMSLARLKLTVNGSKIWKHMFGQMCCLKTVSEVPDERFRNTTFFMTQHDQDNLSRATSLRRSKLSSSENEPDARPFRVHRTMVICEAVDEAESAEIWMKHSE